MNRRTGSGRPTNGHGDTAEMGQSPDDPYSSPATVSSQDAGQRSLRKRLIGYLSLGLAVQDVSVLLRLFCSVLGTDPTIFISSACQSTRLKPVAKEENNHSVATDLNQVQRESRYTISANRRFGAGDAGG